MEIGPIRACITAGRFEYSQHALKRAVERNISCAEIMEAAGNLELLESYPDDKYSPSCLVLGVTRDGRPLHFQLCYTEPETIKIITLYEPSAKEWVDFRIRRPR